jgi:GTP-binding protein Era
MTRAGFVSLVGRPNVGKSTLLNRLAGQKLAIVSPRPQTTRTRITGIRNLEGAQIIFVDTPGLGASGGQLGEYMRETAIRAIQEVDVVCLVVDAADAEEPDALLIEAIRNYPGPVLCLLNKVDRVRPRQRLLPLIDAWRQAHAFREIVPISALDGTGCDRLLELIVPLLPESPPLFPGEATTDQPETFYVAEVVREKLFHFTRDEIPYAVAVQVDELTERPEPPCLVIRATIFVEQESQKPIVIGRGGAMLKRVGTAARHDLEAFFGIKVFLGLTVQVRHHWRRDARALREFGFRLTS